jgi:hypothetical protein
VYSDVRLLYSVVELCCSVEDGYTLGLFCDVSLKYELDGFLLCLVCVVWYVGSVQLLVVLWKWTVCCLYFMDRMLSLLLKYYHSMMLKYNMNGSLLSCHVSSLLVLLPEIW